MGWTTRKARLDLSTAAKNTVWRSFCESFSSQYVSSLRVERFSGHIGFTVFKNTISVFTVV